MSKHFLTPGFVPGIVPSGKKLSPKKLTTNNNRFENRKVPLKEGKSLNDWIRLAASSQGNELASTGGKVLKVTEEDMKNHTDINKGNVWIVLNGKVFNITPYLEYHPGGVDEIMRAAGTDATGLFNEIHPWVAWDSFLKSCFVGHFVGSRENLRPPDPALNDLATLSVTDGGDSSAGVSKIDAKYCNSEILDIRKITRDTNLYVLQRPQNDWHNEIIPLGSHVYFRASIQGIDITRPYTIVVDDIDCKAENNSNPDKLYFIIKLYSNGLFTKHLKDLKKGDSIQISQVYANFVTTRLFSKNTENIFLFAAGTGFTPFVRILNEIFSKKVHLYFFNKTEQDVIWREKLEQFVKNSNSQHQVTHVLSEANDSWTGFRGRISESFARELLKNVQLSSSFVCICGPTGFNDETLRVLQKFGCTKEQIYVFAG